MATPSRFNRSYAELPPAGENTTVMSSGGSLANRPPVPVGRSGMDLNRIAEQRFRQTGNPDLLMSLDYRNLMRDRMLMRPPIPNGRMNGEGSMTRPAFGGSQVYVPPPDAGMTNGEGRMMNEPVPQVPALPAMAPAAPAATPAPFTFPTLPAAQTAWGNDPVNQPLPPSIVGGSAGVPPMMQPDNKNPMPLIPTPQQVTAFGLQPDFSKPQTYNGKQYPTFTQPPPAKQPDPPSVQWEKDPGGRITGGVETVFNPQTGRYDYRRVKVIDANGDGIPDAQQAAPAAAGGKDGFTWKPYMQPKM